MTQPELFPVERPGPAAVIARAIELHQPVATFALFSGGDGSLHATHWAMNNVPGCQVAHINTGIGFAGTRQFVRETCAREGWPLTEIRAKEDCGQDYDEIVLKYGFPGPAQHGKMYIQLKERGIEELVRRHKTKRGQCVMLLTGVKRDDSQRRSGYGGGEITRRKAQVWVNHMYWLTSSEAYHYIAQHGIPRNPVAQLFGMSGECLCGAFAGDGEMAMVRITEPALADRIEALQERAKLAGVHCRWEGKPPRQRADQQTPDFFSPMCVNCLKSEKLAA